METTLLTVLIALTAAALLLQLIALLRRHKPDTDGLDNLFTLRDAELRRALLDEFERTRRESAQFQRGLEESLRQTLALSRKEGAELAERQSARLAQAVDALQQANDAKLEQMRATVDEKLTATLHARLDSSFQTVSQQLENVYKSLGEMQKLSGDVQSLGRLFSNVKSRGTWAEVQLEALLEDILPGRYERDFRPLQGSQAAVEFALRLPMGEGGEVAFLPIDSKFPVEDFQRLCDAADAGDAPGVAAARKALEARVLGEARDVSRYIQPPLTTPFAVLYLATEGLFAEIARSGLIERVRQDYRVTIAGPTTMAALLGTFAFSWRTVSVNKKAADIAKLLSAVKQQYALFGGYLAKTQDYIEKAGRTLGDAQHRTEMIQKRLRGVEELEPDAAETLLLEE